MKQVAFPLVFALLYMLSISGHGQDFFEDIRANGIPILQPDSCKKALITPRLSTQDNSIKVNFFKWRGGGFLCQTAKTQPAGDQPDSTRPDGAQLAQVVLGPDTPNPPVSTKPEYANGWGLNLKAKASDGIGTIFRGADFANGVTLGAYVAFARLDKVLNGRPAGVFTGNIVSLNYTVNSYRFLQANKPVNEQLTDFNTYGGFTASFAQFRKMPFGTDDRDNLYLGYSMSFSQSDNYGDLEKVEVRNTVQYLIGTDSLRIQSTVDDKGYVYAFTDDKSSFLRPFNFQFRVHATYIPKALDYRIAFVTYPEVNHQFDGKTKLNANFALHFLKDGEPSASIVGLFLSFNDIGNAAEKTQPFLKRSLVVGITTAWNLFIVKK